MIRIGVGSVTTHANGCGLNARAGVEETLRYVKAHLNLSGVGETVTHSDVDCSHKWRRAKPDAVRARSKKGGQGM